MYRIITIRVDGSQVHADVSKVPHWTELKNSVGGYIQIVPSFSTYEYCGYKYQRGTVYCDEEGKLKGYAVNRKATEAWYKAHGSRHNDCLVGDIVLIFKLGGVNKPAADEPMRFHPLSIGAVLAHKHKVVL